METPRFKEWIHHKLSLLLCDSATEADSWLEDLQVTSAPFQRFAL